MEDQTPQRPTYSSGITQFLLKEINQIQDSPSKCNRERNQSSKRPTFPKCQDITIIQNSEVGLNCKKILSKDDNQKNQQNYNDLMMMSERSLTTMSAHHQQDNSLMYDQEVQNELRNQSNTSKRNKQMGPSIFEQIRGPATIEGDRFINFRCNDDDDDSISNQYNTKIQLLQFDQAMEDQERKDNQIINDGKKEGQSLAEIENKKNYLALLQNNVLGVENECLLNEIHDSDNNIFKPDLYTQMQKNVDNFGILDPEHTPTRNDGTPGDMMSNCGQFSFTSPPDRLLLSDNTNQQDTSPFNSKFTVLKFNSASKNSANKTGKRSQKSQKSCGSISSNNKMKPRCGQMKLKPKKLIDLQVDGQIMGAGIFQMSNGAGQQLNEQQFGQNDQLNNTDVSFDNNSQLFDENFNMMSQTSNYSTFQGNHTSNKENPQQQQLEKMHHSNHQPGIFSSFEFKPYDTVPSFKNNLFLGMDEDNLKMLQNKKTRKISKIPFKVLDAPQLRDDFYLNLVDWSDSNNLAVALSQSVYIWSAQSSGVTKLHDYAETDDLVASVAWSRLGGQYLSTGTHTGVVHVWDSQTQQLIRTYEGHKGRVGALSWSNSHILSSGSKDKSILNRDLRDKANCLSQIEGHKQEICGLKWSFDDKYLASGGNDNKLMVWENGMSSTNEPLFKFKSHEAAVKAIAWSPHQSSLLASGGGTADRTIKFWNTQEGVELQSIDTGSQVCNLMFSKSSNELVSTHGYSDNAVVVWKYPSMKKIATLTGHSLRVLYLAMSPDAETIVTGAGDETLRFWKIFPKIGHDKNDGLQSLDGFGDCMTKYGKTSSIIR